MLSHLLLAISLGLASASDATELGVVIQRDVRVPMRDGVILRADVHRPDRGGPYPVLVMRTPYGKAKRKFERFVKAGYICVCQDARGRYASDGQWESFLRVPSHDGEDGYDTVQWAAELPGSNGKVGTFGASYNAFLQWRLASLRPPALVCMSAHSIPARYTDLEGPGTIRPGRRLQWWMFTMSPDVRARDGRSVSDDYQHFAERKAERWLWFLPWLKLPREVFEDETDVVHDWLEHPWRDPWKLDEGCKEITVANFDVIGWHDHCNGDLRLDRTIMAEAKSETARKGSRTLIGPWSHSGHGKRKFGNIDFGPEAAVDVVALEIRWFDYWLKGKPNGVDTDAPLKIFVMGDNRWRDERAWPLERTQPRLLYLAGSGHANTPGGDGRLVANKPASPETDHYVYDPADPVPSLHGTASFSHAADQRPLADRRDILVYQTEPLDERLEVTGNPVVELYAASSAPDTDWFVRLVDVAPDGLARDVALGMVRARYRNSVGKPDLITPGEVVKYTIRMGPTSNAFLPGHRIRLDVTSSDFPNYDRNHNTAADQNADATLSVARQTLHHGGPTPTRITLPWVPNDQ